MSLAQDDHTPPSLGWREHASSLLITLWVVCAADGALVFLGAHQLNSLSDLASALWLSLMSASLSAPLALALALLCSLVAHLLSRAYPELSERSPAGRFAWWTSLAFSALCALASAQWALVWAHKLIKREAYQALAVGGVMLSVLALCGLTLPLLSRLLSRISSRPLSWLNAAPTPPLLGAALSALAIAALPALAPALWSPLKTLSLDPLWLTLWALWARAHLTSLPPFSRLSSSSVGGASALIGITLVSLGALLALTAQTLTPREARLITQRGLWAPHALPLARKLTDRDRDGASGLFAGGDCDDTDKRVRPGAYEPVGRDLNCNEYAREAQPLWRALTSFQPAQPSQLPQAPTLKPPKLTLILTIDALRADAYETAMPQTKRFAERAQRFERAYSAGAATYWSIPALMGSKPPSAFKMARDQTPHARERLLFEALSARGVHTALLSNVTIFFVRGLSQGAQTRSFKTSHVTKHGATPGAAHMSGELLRHVDLWRAQKLKPHRERLALWGHIYDPHEPYFELEGRPHASDKERYLGAVRGVDDALADLFKGLEKRGLLSETMILLTADHGDEFGEHGGRFHGRTLYEEMVRVPLWLYHPQLPPQRVTAPFSHLHVAPTLLELLGSPAEPRFEGESWVERLRGVRGVGELKARPSDLAFFEVLPDRNYHEHLVGVSAERWKLIYNINHNAFELYDLNADPHEQRDLSALLTANAQAPSKAERERLSLLKRALLSYAEEHLASLAKGQAGVSKPWGSP